MRTDHMTVNIGRPTVDGKPRYQVQCSCGKRTEIGSRSMAQGQQKNHRKEERANVRRVLS